MNPKRILCPTDFSPCSQQALVEAERIAFTHNAKLFVVHVDVSGAGIPPGYPGYSAELDEHRRLINEATPKDPNVEFELHYLRGQPVDEIRRFSALRDIDIIIMGTHGRTGLARLVMGSVAEQLSTKCCCEVVLIPQDKAKLTLD